MTYSIRLLLILFLSAVIMGCQTAPVRDPGYAPARPAIPPPAPQGTGSIYQHGYANAWFEDLRAKRVGDMLTVKLVEKTNASKTATTSASKSNKNTIDNPVIMGSSPEFKAPGIIPLASNINNSLKFGLSSSHEFSGNGDSSQSNNLTGEVSVSVVEVLSNGYLVVRGEKRIGINRGREYVRLSGIVRPYDIDTTNTVLSTKLGDPTITYSGEGAIADSNVTGWLSRFFTSALFPF